MAAAPSTDILDVATLPLGDGRHIMVPLSALAEVQQVNFAGRPEGDLGEFSWRGYDLKIQSLDAACGLTEPAPERLTTVGVFKADKDMDPPFKALAFSGIASPVRIEPSWLKSLEVSADQHFVGATQLHDQMYLIPDLDKMLFAQS